eukprot:4166484-Amphidinium_carterae.1
MARFHLQHTCTSACNMVVDAFGGVHTVEPSSSLPRLLLHGVSVDAAFNSGAILELTTARKASRDWLLCQNLLLTHKPPRHVKNMELFLTPHSSTHHAVGLLQWQKPVLNTVLSGFKLCLRRFGSNGRRYSKRIGHF